MKRWQQIPPALLALTAAVAAAALSACAASPVPAQADAGVPLTSQWRAWQTADGLFETAQPADAALKGEWWTAFGDPQLNQLAAALLQHNQSLAAASARLAAARAQADVAAAGLLPQLALQAGSARQKTSADRPLASYGGVNQSTVQNNQQLGFAVSYELDLSGRVQQNLAAARAGRQQAEADFENTRLLLMAELLADYGSLRELDQELQIVGNAIRIQTAALELVNQRHRLGVASGLDLAQQQALLDNTKTQLGGLQKQRQQFEHAIATMTGQPASDFRLTEQRWQMRLPPIAAGVPASLLQRRPDIAAAQRAVLAANANLGVARSAYFPSLSLQGNYGWNSTQWGNLLSAPSLLWSLGAALSQSIFDGGKTSAAVAVADASYQATVANYRQTVLVAMQEVEDGLQGRQILQQTAQQAEAAVASAEQVLKLAEVRYRGGVAIYLDVVSAEQNLLNSQRQLVQLRGQQWLNSVYLIKALGGGWQAAAVGQ